jgi:hypothetical protein
MGIPGVMIKKHQKAARQCVRAGAADPALIRQFRLKSLFETLPTAQSGNLKADSPSYSHVNDLNQRAASLLMAVLAGRFSHPVIILSNAWAFCCYRNLNVTQM